MYEIKYKNLLLEILNTGENKINRTNVKTYSIFGKSLFHNLNDGFPVLTSKKMYFKNIIHELIWIINGETNIKYLKDNNVNIWNNWADKNGDLGPIYGYQLRNFNNQYDQLKSLIYNLKNDPFSRRHLVTLWNPLQLDQMKLPPCHFSFQFYITNDNKLNLNVFMRSCDAFIGLPYDFALYATLLIIISKEINMSPNILQLNFTDLHIYENHISQLNKYINNKIHALPELIYDGNINNLNINDFNLINYNCEPYIKADIVI